MREFPRTTLKIPAGYARAGRLASVVQVDDASVTVHVPQNRRKLSPRIVPETLVQVRREDLDDWASNRLYGEN